MNTAMKSALIAGLAAMASAPLLAQAIPNPERPPPTQPSGGGGGFPNIGIGISFGKKKKPAAPTAPPLQMVDADIPDYVDGEVLFFINGTKAAAEKIARAARVTIIEMVELDEIGELMVRAKLAPGDTVEAAMGRLSAQKGVLSAQPNMQYQLLGETARGKGVKQHGIKLDGGPAVSGTILMIDSVVDITNAAFKGAHIEQRIIAEDAAPSAHGTAVAEILVGTGKAGGVAKGAKLISIAAFEPAGESSWLSTTAKLAQAANIALKYSPHVANLSFGANRTDEALLRMLNAYETRGVCVVAAAGNGQGGPVKFPARKATSVAVTAVSGNGKTAYAAASRGPEIDVSAWGVGMLAATPGGMRTVSGTSFATAVVAGGLMRLSSCNGGGNPAAARSTIAGAAKDLGAKGPDDVFGAGLFRLTAGKK